MENISPWDPKEVRLKKEQINKWKRKAIVSPFCVAVTGHRKGIDLQQVYKGAEMLVYLLVNHFHARRDCLTFLHGCASGVDIAFGSAALRMNLDLHLYFPFPYETQKAHANWLETEQKLIELQMKKASKIVYVAKKFYTWGYQKRNMALVDNSQLLATAFTRSRSGSGNCYRYAVEKGRLCVDLLQLANLETHMINSSVSIHDLIK